jgi:hypothetical protein
MSAISRKLVSIAIVNSGTNGSSLTSTDFISGQIKSYTKSGGDKDVESDPHFGGDVSKEKPRNQIEVSFEVTPSTSDLSKWEGLAYGSAVVGGSTVYLSSVDPADKAVFIQVVEGSAIQTFAFDNARVTMLDMEHNADDNMTKNLNLKLSSENESGRANFASALLAATAFPAWSALPNGS